MRFLCNNSVKQACFLALFLALSQIWWQGLVAAVVVGSLSLILWRLSLYTEAPSQAQAQPSEDPALPFLRSIEALLSDLLPLTLAIINGFQVKMAFRPSSNSRRTRI
ncbi:MAG: hypothetical protein WAO12_04340 [Venatoribacter sp.]